jgi:hypothetical protein
LLHVPIEPFADMIRCPVHVFGGGQSASLPQRIESGHVAAGAHIEFVFGPIEASRVFTTYPLQHTSFGAQ